MVVRAALALRVHTATVFDDELGYVKLAESIGREGRLALFGDEGLSFSPLYPVVLSPIYALGASAPTYFAIKVVNALLISLAVFPVYGIARFVLPRRFSLLVAFLSVLAPLMSYPSFTMSENLGYPLCLVAVWAMLEAVRSPSPRADALGLGTIALAVAARIQLFALVPAALTALLLAPMLERDRDRTRTKALARAVREHAVIVGVAGAGLVVAAAAALAGRDVLALAGRYATLAGAACRTWGTFSISSYGISRVSILRWGRSIHREPRGCVRLHSLESSPRRRRLRRSRRRRDWMAVGRSCLRCSTLRPAGRRRGAGHSRALPDLRRALILVALVAACRAAATSVSVRVCLAAGAIAASLPAVIPFHDVINQTIIVDSIGIHPLARNEHGQLVAIPHASGVAILAAATVAVLYVQIRARLRSIVALVLIPFVVTTSLSLSRIEATSRFARSVLPAHVDWVDRANPVGDVVLLTAGRDTTPELETAYSNPSVSRLFYLCRRVGGRVRRTSGHDRHVGAVSGPGRPFGSELCRGAGVASHPRCRLGPESSRTRGVRRAGGPAGPDAARAEGPRPEAVHVVVRFPNGEPSGRTAFL